MPLPTLAREQYTFDEFRAELTGPAREWPLLVVDASDEAAVRELAARTTVLVTTVIAMLTMALVALLLS